MHIFVSRSQDAYSSSGSSGTTRSLFLSPHSQKVYARSGSSGALDVSLCSLFIRAPPTELMAQIGLGLLLFNTTLRRVSTSPDDVFYIIIGFY
jgi:hypothetical protein